MPELAAMIGNLQFRWANGGKVTSFGANNHQIAMQTVATDPKIVNDQ
jgi:hypothetical protein